MWSCVGSLAAQACEPLQTTAPTACKRLWRPVSLVPPLIFLAKILSLLQVYLPVGWSTYFFSAARVTFNTSEVERAQQQVGAPDLPATTMTQSQLMPASPGCPVCPSSPSVWPAPASPRCIADVWKSRNKVADGGKQS